MSKFFINRPIFAWVIALLVTLAGLLALPHLPTTSFPDVAAPAIAITGAYPGASAQTVQDTVVQVIEQKMTGLDGFRYLSSESDADGSFTIIATFDQGTDPDIDQVKVQNKLALAQGMLPPEVQALGLNVGSYQINFILMVGLYCDNGRYQAEDLGDYLISHVKDAVARTKGVGEIMDMTGQYAMRVWLDPAKLYAYQLMPPDVVAAISSQNVQVSAGQLGGQPALPGAELNATIVAKTKMSTAAEFGDIILKTAPDGSVIRLKDVARIELASEMPEITSTFNKYPSAGLAIRLAPGGNVLETSRAIKETMASLEPFFPEGVKTIYPYETAPAVEASVRAIIRTLAEAFLLVFLVMFLFLQEWRATVVPALAIPVVLFGTFAVLFLCGSGLNMTTTMALVLAIGLLVDDAIVVVENVGRLMEEEGLGPKEATEKSMGQIQGALVGIGLVISAVFFPMAFFSGSTGILYRQFSITIITAMSLSVLVALVFTPALCATILKKPAGRGEKKGFFGWFNRFFKLTSGKYQEGVAAVLRRKRLFVAAALGVLALVAFLLPRLPTAFLPDEDNGVLMTLVQLPPNASAERTRQVAGEAIDYYLDEEKETAESVYCLYGFSFAGRGQNVAMIVVKARPFGERKTARQGLFALAERSRQALGRLPGATVVPYVMPAIIELGLSTGFDFYLLDRAGLGHEALMAARDQFLGLAAQNPKLALVRPNGLNDQPQYKITVDEAKASSLSLGLTDINNTMAVAWGSAYVNDFIDRGRVKKVYVQGDAPSRLAPEDFGRWHVRNALGRMVPFPAFSHGEWVLGSPRLERYNGLAALEILGQGAGGVSSGEAMAEVGKIAQELQPGIDLSFTGLSYEERLAGSQAARLYAISLLIIFLCLAALYESWSIPACILMGVPLGALGAVAANLARGLNNDVFFQVGILTVIGLSAKNAILIVEFAKALHEREGKSLAEAALGAARLRFRPILMTSLAFVFGVAPMAVASGASSASQHALGTTVVGGTLTATCLAVFLMPLFYVLVAGLKKR